MSSFVDSAREYHSRSSPNARFLRGQDIWHESRKDTTVSKQMTYIHRGATIMPLPVG